MTVLGEVEEVASQISGPGMRKDREDARFVTRTEDHVGLSRSCSSLIEVLTQTRVAHGHGLTLPLQLDLGQALVGLALSGTLAAEKEKESAKCQSTVR